ncbi:hypothetical protein CPAR01_10076 [Colletotrichum paranaense]|uniref:Uncharacterized protein n=1 Tax=Colletotrichum paranaense TaxID=1914294 RepID=A0ABQ9SCZ6_9PEZI|nr:uncharacterized protein CPAR01_10076 [Colletotrichum paranaense]KAK1533368.1 hypothetical protein CPAR01_10076 [Colletotrichum paranaense]
MDFQPKKQSSRRGSETTIPSRHRSSVPSPYTQPPPQTAFPQTHAGFPINDSYPLALPLNQGNFGQGFPAFVTPSAVEYSDSNSYRHNHNTVTTGYPYSSSAPANSMMSYPPVLSQANSAYADRSSYEVQATSTHQSFLPHRSHPNSPLTSYSGLTGHSSAASSYGYPYAASSATTTPSAANTPVQPLSPTLMGVGSWDNTRQPRETYQQPTVDRSNREGRRVHVTDFPPNPSRSESIEVHRSSSPPREGDIHIKRRSVRPLASCKDDQKSTSSRPRKDDDKDDRRKRTRNEQRREGGSDRRETKTY